MELTARRILREELPRWVGALLVITLPAYGFLLLYRWATGDWQQPDAVVLDGIMRSWQTLVGNFVIPLLLGVWILGFKSWQLVLVAVVAAGLASYVFPSGSLAVQLLPGSFVRVALVAVLLAILLKVATVWYRRRQQLSDTHYAVSALVVMAIACLVCVILLLPPMGMRAV